MTCLLLYGLPRASEVQIQSSPGAFVLYKPPIDGLLGTSTTYMKHLITLVLLLWIGTAEAQRTFTFEIDGDKYSLEENKLNDMFGDSFNALLQRGSVKEKDFDLWAKSFSDWKEPVAQGMWTYKTLGNRVESSTFHGNIPIEYLGWEAPGKSGKGNPNKKDNVAVRMSIMNTYLSRNVITYFTRKEIIN